MSVIDAIVLSSVRSKLAEAEAAIAGGFSRIEMSLRDVRILMRAYVRLAKLRETPAFHSLVEEIRSHGYAMRDNPRAQAFRLLFEVMTEVDHPENAKLKADSETRLRIVK